MSDTISVAPTPASGATGTTPPIPAVLDIRGIDPRALGKVAVLMGGRSAEREVSQMSGQGVLAALQGRGVDAQAFDPAERPLDDLRREGFDRAFIALHGRFGEDGTIQGALELLGIPYTGSGVMASAIGMDKVRTKQIWIARGLPTPRFVVVRSGEGLTDLTEALGLPLIMKPPHEGSTIGVSRVNEVEELLPAWQAAARFDAEVLAEEFIDGAELTVAVIGSGDAAVALPIVEIQAPDGNYDYQNKYFGDDTQYLCPAPLSDLETAEIQRLAVAAYLALGCEGWGRVDFMIPKRTRKPTLLEINTSPGMTSHSLVPMAARAVGVPYDQLVLAITAAAALKVQAPRREPAP